jgi:hypothetical protein
VLVSAVLAFLRPAGEKQVEISELPDWAQPAFKGMKSLNRVQSKVSDCALYSSENMLVCAPTGECFGVCCGGVTLGSFVGIPTRGRFCFLHLR